MSDAVGFLEVYGLTAALVAVDAACKAAHVTIEALDNNRPFQPTPVPLIVLIKMRGSVEDVKAGIEAGANAAEKVSGVISTHVIARPMDEIQPLLQINCIKKK